MYICKDCGKTYNEKVEYCECGNNAFDYIDETPVKKPQRQPMSLEQKSQIVSWVFFIICLSLSVVVWLIPVKSQPVNETKIVNNKTVPQKTFPGIDKIWDSTPVAKPVKQEEAVVEVKEPVTIHDKLIAKLEAPVEKKVEKPKAQTVQKPVAQTKPVQQSTAKTSTQTKPAQTQKPTNTSTQTKTTTQPVQKTTQTTTPVQTQNKNTQNTTRTQQSQAVLPKAEEPKKVVESKKPVYNPNSPEMLRYKGNLRSAMFAKLPVGSIQGSGTCSVTFSIDSTGKLVNRGFARQSDNKTLNDAVYYMMMSVPRFSPPPSGYNGETIRMDFSFNNGSYEISIH